MKKKALLCIKHIITHKLNFQFEKNNKHTMILMWLFVIFQISDTAMLGFKYKHESAKGHKLIINCVLQEKYFKT